MKRKIPQVPNRCRPITGQAALRDNSFITEGCRKSSDFPSRLAVIRRLPNQLAQHRTTRLAKPAQTSFRLAVPVADLATIATTGTPLALGHVSVSASLRPPAGAGLPEHVVHARLAHEPHRRLLTRPQVKRRGLCGLCRVGGARECWVYCPIRCRVLAFDSAAWYEELVPQTCLIGDWATPTGLLRDFSFRL
jgi:hypothetical protein